ncbi:enolase C-terminal domain-like protein [Pelagicoccus mobilis]|uniref:Bifunctional D-altronate/D-mannonate dehydratase n=1 Tax=Pelagicoccus mobilis TaxID=415221 RepID=A0A934RTB7_9BACT|nr:enolase C-terminal domain-like protein [Pelagicoccus mobilis]MBK1876497.1 bifunctional D-altronate/D-mannonate dehydratase [Pelagicoccus mobilis]
MPESVQIPIPEAATRSEKPITIRKVTAIATAPEGTNLIVVKVETSEPELYGLGCATLAYRHKAVISVVEDYLDPLLKGRDVDKIEELWALMNLNAYWRNGPIGNNAISGVDMALWDIKGKRANIPLYSLLGGKYREAAAAYRHSYGRDISEIEDSVHHFRAMGLKHIRIQWRGYGGATNNYGDVPPSTPLGAEKGIYYDPKVYTRKALELIDHVRNIFDQDLELLHDVHERLPTPHAIQFAKDLEPYKLFFLEDLVAPEEPEELEKVRALTSTPLALGELFVSPLEYVPLIQKRHIDFMRMHISCIGGITPARKAAALGELFGVRTAWHGPPDVSPVGHMANLHLDLAVPNFGIQEFCHFNGEIHDVFDGLPELKEGYLYSNERPGIGVYINEEAAKAYPPIEDVTLWTQIRLPDGSLHRP